MMSMQSCISTNTATSAVKNEATYLIKKIDKKNSWYLIYAERKDTLYKIVSKADKNIDKNFTKIIVGQRYDFDLNSTKENTPLIGKVKLDPVGYTGCYQYDSETTICLEPKRGIYDLFTVQNLKGLYIIK